MSGFNGHKNWDYWNVSLWINNDEGLYRLAQKCKNSTATNTLAAYMFLECMDGISKTPDGAEYKLGNVRAAIKGI